MRSRFTAFFQGGCGQYLLNTWHPATRPNCLASDLDKRDTDWVSLVIVAKQQRGQFGMVEFKAFYKSDTGIECLHERSSFERINGVWYYRDGEFK